MPGYLDHNATSPMRPEVSAAIQPFLDNPPANPSSLHRAGRMARSAIESARQDVADLLSCSSDAVIFTASGSEANNLFLKGYVDGNDPRCIISSQIEHPSILEPLNQLQARGQSIKYMPTTEGGEIDLEASLSLIEYENPQLVSIMLANNETGVIQPVAALAAKVDGDCCIVHSDVTQAVGKLPVALNQLGVDALSLSAHKLQGPQGIGALVVKRGSVESLISGGDQEKSRRAGTESVALIVGFGRAAQLARLEIEQKWRHLDRLRLAFEAKLESIAGVVIFGHDSPRLPNTTYFALPYYHGETLLMELDRSGFSLSSGSACHSEVTRPSHVLTSMGVDDALALNAIRVSFGMSNTLQEVDQLVSKLQELVNNLPSVIRRVAV